MAMANEAATRVEGSLWNGLLANRVALSGDWLGLSTLPLLAFEAASAAGEWPRVEAAGELPDSVADLPFMMGVRLARVHGKLNAAQSEYGSAVLVRQLVAPRYAFGEGPNRRIADEATLGEIASGRAEPVGFAADLAAAVVRLAELCGVLGIDLERAVLERLSFRSATGGVAGK